jgi:hypothetical protein
MIWLVSALLALLSAWKVKNRRNAKISGITGEKRVSSLFKRCGYYIFDDLMFVMNGRTVQIDHIAVSTRGVFVVETKNHHGSIIGNAYEKDWHQCINGDDFPLYNPVWQNYGHIKTVQSLLALPQEKIKGIVVFASDPELNLIDGGNVITTLQELPDILDAMSSDILTNDEVTRVCSLIKAANISDKGLDKDHIRQVERIANEKSYA